MPERPRWPWFPLVVWPLALAVALLGGLEGGDGLAWWAHAAATLGLSGWVLGLPAGLAWPRRLALAAFGALTALALVGAVLPWTALAPRAQAHVLALALLPSCAGAALAGLASRPRAVCAVLLPILWWAPWAQAFATASLGLGVQGPSSLCVRKGTHPLGALRLERLLAGGDEESGARATATSPPVVTGSAERAPRVLAAEPLAPEGGYRRGRLVLGGLARPWRGELELRTGLRTWRWTVALEAGGSRALVLRWLDEGRMPELAPRLEGAEACLTGPPALSPPAWPVLARTLADLEAGPEGLCDRLKIWMALTLLAGLGCGTLLVRGRVAPVILYALALPLGWAWVWPGPAVQRRVVQLVRLSAAAAESWRLEVLRGDGRARVLSWRPAGPWPAPYDPADGGRDEQRDDLLRLHLPPGRSRGFYAPAYGPAPRLVPAGQDRWIIENPTAAALWLHPDGEEVPLRGEAAGGGPSGASDRGTPSAAGARTGAPLWLGAGDAAEWRPGPARPARLTGRAVGRAAAEDGLPPGERVWFWEVVLDE